jgi:hypothetical protein
MQDTAGYGLYVTQSGLGTMLVDVTIHDNLKSETKIEKTNRPRTQTVDIIRVSGAVPNSTRLVRKE